MSFRDTAALDYQTADNTETVTLTTVRAGVETDYTVNFAEMSAYARKELQALGGEFHVGDAEWSIGRLELPDDVEPQRGDRITRVSGTVWNLIAEPQMDELAIVWQCPSRKSKRP